MAKQQTHTGANQHIKDLLLLFSIPAAIIIVLVCFIFVPRLFANPGYDFIFCEGYNCTRSFSVDSSGKIVEAATTNRTYYDAHLYYYDTERGASRPIEISEAESYRLDPLSKSPDGYTLKRSSSSGGFLFWGSYNDGGWTLNKGILSKPVDLGGNDMTKLIGWILR